MTKHRWIKQAQLAALLLSLVIVSPRAEATVLNTCIRMLTQLALPYAVEYHKGKTIRPKNWETDTTELVLGERIGIGDRGGLYQINRSSTIQGIPTTMVGLVAKVPHTVKFSKDSAPHAQAELEMKREIHTYDLLKSRWPEVEKEIGRAHV